MRLNPDELISMFGPPDDFACDPSSPSNTAKARRARACIELYASLSAVGEPTPVRHYIPALDESWDETDAEAFISDLITDLYLLATAVGIDLELVQHRADRDFHAEVSRGFEEET